jgi:hypothetical protein
LLFTSLLSIARRTITPEGVERGLLDDGVGDTLVLVPEGSIRPLDTKPAFLPNQPQFSVSRPVLSRTTIGGPPAITGGNEMTRRHGRVAYLISADGRGWYFAPRVTIRIMPSLLLRM